MKNILAAVSVLTLFGCANYQQVENNTQAVAGENLCIGSSNLPEDLADKFKSIDDDSFLETALGSPQKGKLCQGQAYVSKKDSQVVLYRAWNSTNPNSKFGKWWAFKKPAGEVAKYRSDYEICYQWSPLDKLVSCTLEANTKVVVGTGQSAECSEFLTYPVSHEQQIYIEDASISLTDCSVFKGEFNWK
ncbi:MAG: hypothetical protein ACI9W6_002865 [Motiliproteus sp.]|jgi:hypothetical protein